MVLRARPVVTRRLAATAAALLGTALTPLAAAAQDGTWSGPGNDYNNGANWTPATVPTGQATFADTGPVIVDITTDASIDEILFTPNASLYLLTNNANFGVNGAGITNLSSQGSTFLNLGNLTFSNSALVDGGPTGLVLLNNSPMLGVDPSLVFNQNSGIGATVDLVSSAGSGFGAGASASGGNVTVIFNGTSYADGADLRFLGGTGSGLGGAGVPGSGRGGASVVTFNGSSHADNASISNISATGAGVGGADPLAGGSGIGGGASLTFNDSSHADGAMIVNLISSAVGLGGTNFAPGTGIASGASVTFNNDSHADNADISTIVQSIFAVGGSGASGLPGGNAAGGGEGFATSGAASIFFNDDSHADNSTFQIGNGGTISVGGSGGAGDTGAGGAGGAASAVNGVAQIVFNENSHADDATFVTASAQAIASGGTGGQGGTAGTGGAGGAALSVAGGTFIWFNNTAGTTGATITNIGGDATAFGGAGGSGGSGGSGGVGGDASAFGGAANIRFSGTASAGTGTTILNAGGYAMATGGRGGNGGTGAGADGGQGGAATAYAGGATIEFLGNSSAGDAVIRNVSGTAMLASGSGGNGAVGNGGNSGTAFAYGGDAVISFNDNATAGTATIDNVGAGSLTVLPGSSGADGPGGGLGGSSSGGEVATGEARVEFNGNATGGGARITNTLATTVFNDNSVFGTAAGAQIINNGAGVARFNDTSSLGTGGIRNNDGATVIFAGSATAGSGMIDNAEGGFVGFRDGSSASNATIDNAAGGIIQFGDTSTAGNGLINNSGELYFTGAADAVTARIINGATGGVAVGVDGLRIGSLSGSGVVYTNGNTLQVGYLDLDDTFSGVISGGGALVKRGGGTLILTGENSYTGGTTVAEGRLQIGDGGTTGSVAGDILVTNDTELIFNLSGPRLYAGIISGGGNLTKTGTGSLVLTGENTITGTTVVNQGILQIGNGGTTGSIASDVVVAGGAMLAFSRSDNLTYAGSIFGQGVVYKDGAGTLVFTGTSSYTGGTAIAGGTLQLGDGGTTGAIVGDVFLGEDGTLAFNRSDLVTFGGDISGAGQLSKLGAGTLILTGDASQTGGTTVDDGALVVGDGGTTGSLAGDVTLVNSTAVLGFNRSDTITFGNVVSGMGALAQSGTGTLILTGASTHGGGTFVNAGTLQLNGSVASTMNVGAAGRLTGIGLVNGDLVANGIVSPGTATAPLGTLSVTGNAAFNAGSILAPAITASGQSSLLQAGSLTINGGTVRPTAASGGLFLLQTDYRIAVGTGGRTGTFGGVDESLLPSFLDATLFYTATEAFLRVRRNATTFAQTTGLTPNQAGVSTALDAAVAGNNALAFTDYLSTYNALLMAQAGTGLQAALDTLSGDALTATPVAAREHANRFADRLDTNTWSNSSNLWGLIAYGDQDVDGDGNGPGFGANGLEFQIGFNTSLGHHTRLGISAGYNDADVDLNDRAATANIETWSIGAHLRHDFGPAYVSGQLTYSWHSIDTSRILLLGGTATGDFDANSWTAALEAGGVFRSGQVSIEPHVSIRHASTDQDAYREAGPSGALDVAAADYETTRYGVGVRVANREPTAPVRFHAMLRYEHETGESLAVLDNALPGLPAFRVFGPQLGDDILTADVGAEIQLSQGLSLFASGGGHTRSNETSLNASAGLRIRF